MTMKVRAVTPDDVHQLSTLYTDLQKRYVELAYPTDFRELERSSDLGHVIYETVYATEGTLVKTFVAEDPSEELVGFVTGELIPSYYDLGRVGSIRNFYVENQSVLKKVGESLFAAVEEWFERSQCRYVRTETWIVNGRYVESFRDLTRKGFSVHVVTRESVRSDPRYR